MRMPCPVTKRSAMALMVVLMSTAGLSALNFEAGSYGFDNSKLKFSTVKMVVGNVTREFTRVCDMSPVEGKQWWQGQIADDLWDLDYFTFVETDAMAGTYHQRMSAFLDSLKQESNGTLRRTGLNSKANLSGADTDLWIYCPLNDTQLSNGYWRPSSSYNATTSGTLPVVYLNTRDSATIVSKDHYMQGNLWIDDDIAPLGSEAEPLDIEVKGRGNWTWKNSFKKPYKIKFAAKQAPLGLDRSRHFVLLAHNEDFSGYLRSATGFELSRLLDMPYTPGEVPVELVLNGDYMGLYFLCEKIRVEGGRVDIFEQSDLEQNPDNATGGWLLELSDDGDKVIDQHQNNDPANPRFSFVSHSPEVLSNVQRSYIHNLIARADSAIYVPNKNDRHWEQLIDIDQAARFYVIHEVMENVEAFSGSMFIYKDLGWDEKLKFGPVWDFDNSYYKEGTTGNHFIYDYPSPFSFLWIKEMLKFPRFQLAVRRVWQQFNSNNVLQSLNQNASQWREKLIVAEQQDRLRWHLYASNHSPESPSVYLGIIAKKVAWLDSQWLPSADVNRDGSVTATDVTVICNHLLDDGGAYNLLLDLDSDGAITATDVTIVYNHLLDY